MVTTSAFTVRLANSGDSAVICRIHNLNVRDRVSDRTRGFLLADLSETELMEMLARSTQYFVAENDDGEIVGFVSVTTPQISEEMLDRILWNDPIYKQKVTQDNPIYIKTLATHPEYTGRGVARSLYRFLYRQFPPSVLSSFIANKPICNTRSLQFHDKQGFDRAATLQLPQLGDLKNYESILMFKSVT